MDREQMIKVVLNAINASKSPAGETPVDDATLEEVTEGVSLRAGQYDDIQISHKGHINVDAFRGRQVKLFIQRFTAEKREDDIYSIYDDVANPDFQTWSDTYASNLELIQSVITNPIIKEDDWEITAAREAKERARAKADAEWEAAQIEAQNQLVKKEEEE